MLTTRQRCSKKKFYNEATNKQKNVNIILRKRTLFRFRPHIKIAIVL